MVWLRLSAWNRHVACRWNSEAALGSSAAPQPDRHVGAGALLCCRRALSAGLKLLVWTQRDWYALTLSDLALHMQPTALAACQGASLQAWPFRHTKLTIFLCSRADSGEFGRL